MRVFGKGIGWILRILGKILMLPMIAILTILQWIGIAAVNISTLIFELTGGVFIISGILSFAFGQEPAGIVWRMIATGVGAYLLPKAGEKIVFKITYLNYLVKTWFTT